MATTGWLKPNRVRSAPWKSRAGPSRSCSSWQLHRPQCNVRPGRILLIKPISSPVHTPTARCIRGTNNRSLQLLQRGFEAATRKVCLKGDSVRRGFNRIRNLARYALWSRSTTPRRESFRTDCFGYAKMLAESRFRSKRIGGDIPTCRSRSPCPFHLAQ